MIDFLILVNFNENINAEELKKIFSWPAGDILVSDNTRYIILQDEEFYCVVVGDIIKPHSVNIDSLEYLMQLLKSFSPQKLRFIKGLFYIIIINKVNNELSIFSSLFSILPLYFYKNSNKIILSSRIHMIIPIARNKLTCNKKYILEQIIFNYSFLNETIFKEIKLVPSNSYVQINKNSLLIQKHTDMGYYFTKEQFSWQSSGEHISEVFIENAKDYFPEGEFTVSFSGGFDGRTLVACAEKLNKNYKTYSFGSHRSEDIIIPQRNAQEIGVVFAPIYLDESVYIVKEFLTNGIELINLSSLAMNLLYTHFLYSAKILSKKSNYLLQGFFGSELLRTQHIAGAVTSEELVKYFNSEDQDDWIKCIRTSPKLRIFKNNIFKSEVEELVQEMIAYKQSINHSFTKNQKFYLYIFEETFRKIFGSIINAQMEYINVRTPYLDFRFIEELLKTNLAGVNNPFFTHNPIRRFKGQFLYALIIKKTSDIISRQYTDRGYRPSDLTRPLGYLNMLTPYLQKKISKLFIKKSLDNFLILSALKFNKEYFISIIDDNIYNKPYIIDLLQKVDILRERNRDILLFALSTSQFIKQNNIRSHQ